jgi:hypothetical protein
MHKISRWICLFFLFSCSDSPADAPIGDMKHPDELIRFTVFETESEKYLSFPLLFNQKVIRDLKIAGIRRSYFVIDSMDHQTGKMRTEQRNYHFRNGQISSIDLLYYYDDRQIGHKRVVYLRKTMPNGFKEAMIQRDSGAVTDREFVESGFQVHQLARVKRRYLAFEEKTSGRMLFFMRNKAYWGALSVDSILNPSPVDRVVLGSPLFPIKSYMVENRIKESDAVTYKYHPYLKRIQRMVMEDFPFTTIRTFFYDKEGYCNSYIDSTFSSRKYLLRTATRIQLDSRKCPVVITHKKETAFRKLGVTAIETFEYDF